MNELKDTVEFEKITLPLMKVAVSERIKLGSLSLDRMRLDGYRDYFMDSMVYNLSTYLIGNKVHEYPVDDIKYPADWKEAFKERWFPEFLKRRYPVRYKYESTVIHHYHLCPHVEAPWGRGEHIEFLTMMDEEYHSLNGTKTK